MPATFPGRGAARSGALQTRDRHICRTWDDPGSRCAVAAASCPGNADGPGLAIGTRARSFEVEIDIGALDLWWSMIFSENRYPLFRIML